MVRQLPGQWHIQARTLAPFLPLGAGVDNWQSADGSCAKFSVTENRGPKTEEISMLSQEMEVVMLMGHCTETSTTISLC